jgi:hypothetical protein
MKTLSHNSMRRSPEMFYLCGDRRALLVIWQSRKADDPTHIIRIINYY